MFCDFSVCFLEIFESNVIIISPFDNFLVAIVLPISRCLLIEEVKEQPLRWYCADVLLSGTKVIFITVLVGIDRVEELDVEFDFRISVQFLICAEGVYRVFSVCYSYFCIRDSLSACCCSRRVNASKTYSIIIAKSFFWQVSRALTLRILEVKEG